MDSLETLLRRLEGEVGAGAEAAVGGGAASELEALRAAAAAASAATPSTDTIPPARPAGPGSLNALNPEISVSGDVLGHVSAADPGEDNFVLREVELALQSALDPFSRARIFAGFHGEGPELTPFGEHAGYAPGGAEIGGEEAHGHAGGFTVEEAYVEWLGLPGGISLKLGRFNQRFGRLNRWHSHALPFQSRSLPHLAFIGEEPLGQAGVSASTLLPFLPGGAWEATLEVTRSSNEHLFGESRRPSVLGHLNAFWQLSRATDLDAGVSWIHGSHLDERGRVGRDLQGAEASFTWRPPTRARYRSVVLRAGVMRLAGLVAGDDPARAAGEDNAFGVWSMAEIRLSPRWYVGGRVDWSQNPRNPGEAAWLFSPTLTWWQSEWVRLRLEYDVLERSWSDDDEGRLWLWLSFAMGPHKHETY